MESFKDLFDVNLIFSPSTSIEFKTEQKTERYVFFRLQPNNICRKIKWNAHTRNHNRNVHCESVSWTLNIPFTFYLEHKHFQNPIVSPLWMHSNFVLFFFCFVLLLFLCNFQCMRHRRFEQISEKKTGRIETKQNSNNNHHF